MSIDDLTQLPEAYVDKPVRTRGRLEMQPQTGGGGLGYVLRGTFGGRLYVYPMTQVANEWADDARTWLGREVQVSGLVGMGTDPTSRASLVYISIWGYLGPPDEKPVARDQAIQATLEELVTKPGQLDGKTVRVRGQFRGQNLFGDLPSASRRRSADWVIKDDVFAVWVTGRKPKGSGWGSTPGSSGTRASGWRSGSAARPCAVSSRSSASVTLSKPPTPTAQAPPPAPPPPRPKKPPVVVFSLPLDGEREVAAEHRLQGAVQQGHGRGELQGPRGPALRGTARSRVIASSTP